MSSAETLKNRPLLWVLEDEAEVADMYRMLLSDSYELAFFRSLDEFKGALASDVPRPSLLLADLRLGSVNFLDAVRDLDLPGRLRAPFVVISYVDDLETLRDCFRFGAVDYLAKPFRRNELVVKLERLLDRPQVHLNPMKLELTRPGLKPVRLTAIELRIFSALHESGGVLARRDLIQRVWPDEEVSAKALDVHLFHLRKKLAQLQMEIVFEQPGQFRLNFLQPETDQAQKA